MMEEFELMYKQSKSSGFVCDILHIFLIYNREAHAETSHIIFIHKSLLLGTVLRLSMGFANV